MLNIIGLSKIYPGSKRNALDDITFSVNKGEIVGLLGPNGAGKTTTIKCICGLVEPTRGSIEIDGLKIRNQARSLSVLLEGNRNIYWRLTVFENLRFFCNLQGLSSNRKYIDSLIGFFHLEDKRNTQARFLSQGMQQKLAVACTLCRQTPIIILDEPTLGLDVESSYELRGLLKQISQIYQKTILLSSHDMNVVEHVCERVVIINTRLIVADSLYKLRNLFNVNAYEITIDNQLDQHQSDQIRNIFSMSEIVLSPHTSTITLMIAGSENLYSLFNILQAGKNKILSIQKMDPNFEQIYLKLLSNKKT